MFSDSQERINEQFEFHIINTIDIHDKNYIGLNIAIDDSECNQFIIRADNYCKYMNNIINVKMKDIKLKWIMNKNYLEIKDYRYSDEIKIIEKKDLKPFKFELLELTDNFERINGKIISINIPTFFNK